MSAERELHGELRCPHCGSEDFESVENPFEVDLRCLRCGACWHVELGYMSRVRSRSPTANARLTNSK